MPSFAYTALDARGTEKSGLLDAPDVKQVALILRGQGLFPTEVAIAAAADRKVERDLPPSSGLWRTGQARSETVPPVRSGLGDGGRPGSTIHRNHCPDNFYFGG